MKKIFSYNNVILVLLIFIIIIISSDVSLSLNTLFAVCGVLITVVAFAVACYIFVLSITANSEIKEIKQINNQFTSARDDLYQIREAGLKLSQQMVRMIEDFIDEQLYLATHGRLPSIVQQEMEFYFRERNNNLLRSRSNLALKYSFIDKERRANRIKELIAVGNKSTLPLLEKVIEDPNESDDIVEIARDVYSHLLEKVK